MNKVLTSPLVCRASSGLRQVFLCMTFVGLLVFFITSAVGVAVAFDVYMPDLSKTPGDVLTTDAKVLCKDHYTKTVRSVPLKIAKQVFTLYGIPYAQHSKYEVDHLISLELGGSNDPKNLWPQKYCTKSDCFGAREKDVVETNLHMRICAGRIGVADAQHIIVTDWYAEYKRIKGE